MSKNMSKYVIDMSRCVNRGVFRSLVIYFDMFMDVFWHDFPVITKVLEKYVQICHRYVKVC